MNNFEKEGIASIWIGLQEYDENGLQADVLEDLCGVEYYDLDFQEGNSANNEIVPLRNLLEELSYSGSFLDQAIEKASSIGIEEARWVTVQYDFAYDPKRVTKTISSDPIFLGCFEFIDNNDYSEYVFE